MLTLPMVDMCMKEEVEREQSGPLTETGRWNSLEETRGSFTIETVARSKKNFRHGELNPGLPRPH
jgi:hypothetical protein